MNDNLYLNICHHTPSTEITEDDVEKIRKIEQEGRMLFKRLRKE